MNNSAGLLIGGQWRQGQGAEMQSINPASGQVIWSGNAASTDDVDLAMRRAAAAFENWRDCDFSEREAITRRFAQFLDRDRERLADIIGQETGKPLWESRTEIGAMIGKIEISVRAYHERTGSTQTQNGNVTHQLRHRPHGVVAVFGPYNFPGHLPNGHIVPALLAGNCVLFKPSEQTPWIAEETAKLWQQAGLPQGVLNVLQGERATGEALAAHPGLNGLYFTGSAKTGHHLNRQFSDRPGVILGLEMGGNNPLIVGSVANQRAALHDIILSAFLSAGQRCTCARRLFIKRNAAGDALLDALVTVPNKIRISHYNDAEPPFMGPLISAVAAQQLMTAQENLIASGATALVPMRTLAQGPAFLSPGIIDVSAVSKLPDEEHFGPLLQVMRYDTLAEAIESANDTRYGLSAGLLSDDAHDWKEFELGIRAGIVNWNRPTTGASSAAPFGGIGASGNHRPSAYYAADYCAHPVASVIAAASELPATPMPGLTL